MTTKFLAAAASFTDDGECTVLAFADHPTDPVHYVILQMADAPDAEEVAYGLGGVHIDGGALGVDGYDLIRDLRETQAGIVVILNSDTARRAGIGSDIEIELTPDARSAIPLDAAVQAFKARLLSWEAANAKPE